MDKKIIGLNTKTLEEKVFTTIKEAEKEIELRGTVKRCLNNEIKSTKGWLFRYENEDFPEKARTITDKRIKVVVLSKEQEQIKLPLEMVKNLYGIPKPMIIEAIQYKRKINGYSVRRATKEEQKITLSNISYIDYIKTVNNPNNIKIIKNKGSFGEQLVKTILDYNNIEYKREYSFKNELGTIQRMDFLAVVDNKKYCIEYMGEQHYVEKGNKWGSLEKRQFLDSIKKKYCYENGIYYIDISYKNSDLESVFNVINKHIPGIKKPNKSIIDIGVTINIEEMLEYYKEHTKKDTAYKYGVNEHNIDNLLVNLNYESKRKPKDIIQVYKRDEKIFEGTYNEIKDAFNFTMSNVLKCLNGELDKTSQHYFKYKDSEKDRVRQLKTKERHNKRGTVRGSSNKDVVLKDIYSGEETVYSSIKECHEITGLNKDKLYKLFNPNKSKQIIDKYIGKSYGGEYPITAEEALNIINP